ncbi:MAG: hypothetical protein ACOH1L_01830 [Thermomonas sp.]
MTWILVWSRQVPEGSDVLTMRALTGIKQTSMAGGPAEMRAG